MATVLLWLGVVLLAAWVIFVMAVKVASAVVHLALLAGLALIGWALAKRAWRRRRGPTV